MSTAIESVAHHEAGHAVAAYLVGRPFRYLTVEPAEGTLGHIRYRAWDRRFHPEEGGWTPRTEVTIRNAIVTALSGPAAEAYLTGRNNRGGASADYEWATDLAMRACGSSDETSAYLGWLTVRARELVRARRNWKAIGALARRLKKERTIAYRRAVQIIGASLHPPLSPDLLAQLARNAAGRGQAAL